MECKKCNQKCQKWGKQKNGAQRYYCKYCRKCLQETYQKCAYVIDLKKWIVKLVKNSVGIRGISKVLQVSTNTVMKYIKIIASEVLKPPIPLKRKSFEIDELRTYIGNKQNQYWVAYVLCSETKKVIDFIVGKRSKRILRMVVNTAFQSGVSVIKTDKLSIYQSLIPSQRHISNAYNINYIERNNLNLRTHLKRLTRRTICFSRSIIMLEACLRIYFWYQ